MRFPTAFAACALICTSVDAAPAQWVPQQTDTLRPSSIWPQSEAYGRALAVDGDTAVVGAPRNIVNPYVRVYVLVGGVWTEEAVLYPSAVTPASAFGDALDLDGDTLVVGAPDTGAKEGKAFVFTRQGGVWSEQAVITANVGNDDRFGVAVAVDGDTLAVGAEGAGASSSGAAFVFTRTGTAWSQQAMLVAGNAAPGDLFGESLALDGDTLLVGARHQDQGGNNRGTAYVFDRVGSTWSQTTKLRASDGQINDNFGSAVALEGATAVVGAFMRKLGVMQDAGAAYVFENLGGTWVEQAILTASDGAAGDEFGDSLALSGDTLVVGAALDDHAGGTDAGSAYVFVVGGASWSEQAHLFASDPEAESFGRAVGIAGDRILAGSDFDHPLMNAVGRVYGFVRSAGTWSEDLAHSSPIEAMTRFFGWATDLDGDTVLVSDPLATTEQGGFAGSAWVFISGPGGWTQEAWFHDAGGHDDDLLGQDVALDGDAAAVGSLDGDTLGLVDSGSAFVYERAGGVWGPGQPLIPGQLAPRDEFGSALALQGDRLVVGAPDADAGGVTDSGRVFVFERAPGPLGTWAQTAELSPADRRPGDRFGASVALDGWTLVVGAEFAQGAGPGAGAVYVYVLAGGIWQQQARLAPEPTTWARFGASLDLDGNTLLVGAPRSLVEGEPTGAVFFFDRTGSSWGPAVRAFASDGRAYDEFGTSVSLDGDAALVGAPFFPFTDDGRAYVFLRSSVGWGEVLAFEAADTDEGDRFCHSSDLEGNRMLIGALENSWELAPFGLKEGPGLAYLFELEAPAPVSYCTAGTSASGCQALLSSSGLPSVSAAAGFLVTATGVEGSKDGTFYYGTHGPQASPWGSSSSLQCVVPPIARVGFTAGVGTSGSCDGAFAADLNALWTSKPSAAPGAGVTVQVQLWYRDPLNTSGQGTSLSDALELIVGP